MTSQVLLGTVGHDVQERGIQVKRLFQVETTKY